MPPQDTAHIPLGHLRAAVRTICNGFLYHTIYSEIEWDLAVTTLGLAHEQLGGPTRQHLHALFAAAHPDTHPDELATALLALARTSTSPRARPDA